MIFWKNESLRVGDQFYLIFQKKTNFIFDKILIFEKNIDFHKKK